MYMVAEKSTHLVIFCVMMALRSGQPGKKAASDTGSRRGLLLSLHPGTIYVSGYVYKYVYIFGYCNHVCIRDWMKNCIQA